MFYDPLKNLTYTTAKKSIVSSGDTFFRISRNLKDVQNEILIKNVGCGFPNISLNT